jgi:hypothetical protein
MGVFYCFDTTRFGLLGIDGIISKLRHQKISGLHQKPTKQDAPKLVMTPGIAGGLILAL